jgi:hypothetical protein
MRLYNCPDAAMHDQTCAMGGMYNHTVLKHKRRTLLRKEALQVLAATLALRSDAWLSARGLWCVSRGVAAPLRTAQVGARPFAMVTGYPLR